MREVKFIRNLKNNLRNKKLEKLEDEIEKIEDMIDEIIKNSRNKNGNISEDAFIEAFKYNNDFRVPLFYARLLIFKPFSPCQKDIQESDFRAWLIKIFKLNELEENLDKLIEKYEREEHKQ